MNGLIKCTYLAPCERVKNEKYITVGLVTFYWREEAHITISSNDFKGYYTYIRRI